MNLFDLFDNNFTEGQKKEIRFLAFVLALAVFGLGVFVGAILP